MTTPSKYDTILNVSLVFGEYVFGSTCHFPLVPLREAALIEKVTRYGSVEGE